jgi:DNA mismatch repair protein MutS
MAVVKRAEEVLGALEKSNQAGAVTKLAEDLPLFAHKPPPSAAREEVPAAATKLAAEVAKLRPDDLTPRDALEALYRLKALETDD